MSELPTVTIRKGDGYAIINESDFDSEVHEIYEGALDEANQEEEAEVSDGLNELTRAELVEAAESAGVDIDSIEGTGKNGALKNADIAAAIREARSE